MFGAGIADLPEQSERCRREDIVPIRDTRILPVCGEEILHQIIGTDRNEVDRVDHVLDGPGNAGGFQHQADLDLGRERMPVVLGMLQFALKHGAGRTHFPRRGNHREHHMQRPASSGLDQGAQLVAQQARPIEAHPDGAPAQRRIGFDHGGRERRHLVTTQIEGAKHDRFAIGRVEHAAIDGSLGVKPGQGVGDHELEFSAEQTDPVGASLFEMAQFDQQAGIDVQTNPLAIQGHRRSAHLGIGETPDREDLQTLVIGFDHIDSRADVQHAKFCVEDDRIAILGAIKGAFEAADQRNTERLGNNRRVRGGGPLFKRHAEQFGPVKIEQFGGADIAGDQDGVVGQGDLGCRMAVEMPQQAIGQVLKVVQALAEGQIGGLHQPGPVLIADPFNRRFRRQAKPHSLTQTLQPAAIMGEHAIGLQNIARRSTERHPPAFKHVVNRGAQTINRRVEACLFACSILGDQPVGADMRLEQYGHALHQTAGKSPALQPLRLGLAHVEAGHFLGIDDIAGSHDLGEHHGHGLQRVDLVLADLALHCRLRRQHTNQAATAQDRHADKSVEGFFAGLGPVGEGGVRTGIKCRKRARPPRHQAYQAFTGLQAGMVDSFSLQAVGGA